MAVYDDQDQRTSAEHLRKITGISPEEEREMEKAAYDDKFDDIRNQEEQGDQTEESGGKKSKDTDEGEEDEDDGGGEKGEDKKKLSNKQLNEAESKKKESSAEGGGKDGDGDKGPDGKVKSKVKELSQNKLFMGIAAGGGAVVVVLIMLLIIAIGFFKIPNFAEHIAAYQFVRVTRDMSRASENIHATKMAVDASDDSTYGRLKQKYNAAGGKVAEKWSKFDKLRPNKVVKNMQRDKQLKFNYTRATLLRPNGKLTSVEVNGKKIDVKPPSLGSRFIPGVQFARDISFASEFAPTLRTAVASNDVGPIIRGAIGRNMRRQLGISLIAWNIGKYIGKDTNQSKLQIQKDVREKVKAGRPVVNAKLSESMNKTAQEADDAETKALDTDDPAKAAEYIDEVNEPSKAVSEVLDNAFKPSAFEAVGTKILGIFNGVYAVAVPLCIVHEGSLTNAGPSIDKQSEEAQRAFYTVMSGGDQTKDGYEAHGNAVGALGWKLGDIENSNPELRASGELVDTKNSPNTQSSPTGQISIADVLLPPALASFVDGIASTCPVITNTWVAIAGGLINIAVVVFTFGGAAGAEAGAQVATRVALAGIMKKIVQPLITKKFWVQAGAVTGVTAIATLIAKMIVLNNIGGQQSALDVGVPFANMADNGGNQHAQQIERQALFNRPLTNDEVAMNNVLDQHTLAERAREKSLFARYLAPDNPDSMLTRVGSITARNLGMDNFRGHFNLGSSVLNPLNALRSSFGSLSVATVGAQTTDTWNYGNVQFGYSQDEINKIEMDPKTNKPRDETYEPLENRLILDQSGKEDEIAAKYLACFDSQTTMGIMLTEETGEGGNDKHFIVRDEEGNIDPDKGLCSRRNLSFNNPQYGDLVFRWRVDHSYDAALGQIEEAQDPTVHDPQTAGAGGAAGGALGVGSKFTFPLISTQSEVAKGWCEDSTKSCHAGHPAADLVIKPGTQVVAAVGGKILTKKRNDQSCSLSAGHSGYPTIQIKGSDGNYYFYAHFASGSLLSKGVGDTVAAGEKLGTVGPANCGQGTPHLHIQWYTSVINGSNESMDIQKPLVDAFKALPP